MFEKDIVEAWEVAEVIKLGEIASKGDNIEYFSYEYVNCDDIIFATLGSILDSQLN